MRLNNKENVEVEKILADVRVDLGNTVREILREEQADLEYYRFLRKSA